MPESAEQQAGGSDIERLADGLALWGEHKPQTPLDWIEVARRLHDADELRAASPLFQALCWVVGELDGKWPERKRS